MDGEGLPVVLSEIGVRYLYVPAEPWSAGSCWSCCSREQGMREIGAGVAPENTEPQAVSAWEVTQGLASGPFYKGWIRSSYVFSFPFCHLSWLLSAPLTFTMKGTTPVHSSLLQRRGAVWPGSPRNCEAPQRNRRSNIGVHKKHE